MAIEPVQTVKMTRGSSKSRGVFITFEGGEGAGKSTQIKHLAARLGASGVSVKTTREPGGSEFGERARTLLLDPKAGPKFPLGQALLFYAARSDHLDETIRPALATGHWVLCDRFADSTRAYQGAASGVDAATIDALDQKVVGQDQPDITFLLDLDAKVGLARADRRRAATPGTFIAADTFEARQLEFHQRLRQGFLDIAKTNAARVVVVDAALNELAIADAIWAEVNARFSSRFDLHQGNA